MKTYISLSLCQVFECRINKDFEKENLEYAKKLEKLNKPQPQPQPKTQKKKSK